jgi:large subunit ribosomal protein L31e
MTEKTKPNKKEKSVVFEREYVIPLREKCRVVPRYKKTNKAIKTIKEFLAQHMKVRDRDLKKIKLDRYLNEAVWSRGIKNPLSKVKVKATKEGDIVRAELMDMPKNLKFKKAREERLEKQSEAIAKGKKAEKTKEEKSNVEEPNAEKKLEEKEKKSAVIEEEEGIEKEMAKKKRHDVKEMNPSQERRYETKRDATY